MTQHVSRLPLALDPLIAEAKRRMRKRRGLAVALVVVLVAGSVGATLGLRGGGSHAVPVALLKLIHSGNNNGVTGRTVEVYGPSSRSAINKASSGAVMKDTPAERSGCYLVVYHGRFEAPSSPGPPPPGVKPRHYPVMTNVWCAAEGYTDYGVGYRACPSQCRLGGPIVVALKR
jgi:hypothetical protein